MQWTREQDALLAQLWDTGQSGSQIGKQLGVSRCSILGRARRIGLPPRISEESKAFTRPRRKASKFNFGTVAAKPKPKPVLAPEPFVSRETIVTPEHERVRFEVLEQFDRRCRYPHGDEPPYTYCGAKAVRGQPWCPTHFKACAPALAAKHEAAQQLSGNPGQLEQPQNLRELEAVP